MSLSKYSTAPHSAPILFRRRTSRRVHSARKASAEGIVKHQRQSQRRLQAAKDFLDQSFPFVWVRKMPINKLLKYLKVSPNRPSGSTHAFTFALKALDVVHRNDPVCRIVAAKVIEIDKAGIFMTLMISPKSQQSSWAWRSKAVSVWPIELLCDLSYLSPGHQVDGGSLLHSQRHQMTALVSIAPHL